MDDEWRNINRSLNDTIFNYINTLSDAKPIGVEYIDGGYFVPFRDKTTGQQTYEGGRYIEFESDRDLETGDEIVLDLNLAYSPFCAYSETFACPLPPEENWLDVVIPAGEKSL